MTITNRAELDKCRESAEKQLNAYDCRILVCSGTGCIATGSEKFIKNAGNRRRRTGCYH